MLRASTFWELERDAPILNLENGFLRNESELVFERVNKWSNLAGLENHDSSNPTLEIPNVDKPDRIFVADAERTFRSEPNRQRFVKILAFLCDRFGDYAQALSYVSSFLLLTMDEPSAIQLLSHLNQEERFIPGYWRAEAIAFATDAYVFQHLVIHFHPEVAKHLQSSSIDPATFCQKWFVGLCVHVLPFEHLFNFFEKFLAGGYLFLMKFGLSLVNQLKGRLLKVHSNPAHIFALLRLDPKEIPHDRELLEKIINGADEYDLSEFDFKSLRQEAYDTHLRQRIERARQYLERGDSDDEIEDCQLCKDDFPEVHCKTCDLKICEKCHKHPPNGSKHLPSHRVRVIDEDENTDDNEGEENADDEKSSNHEIHLNGKHADIEHLADELSNLKVDNNGA